MKRFRKLLLFLLIPVVLVILLIALAFVPAVQTAIAKRVLGSLDGITASVDHVAVGLSQVRVNGFKIAQPGVMVDLPSLELDAPLLDAAKSKVDVKRLSANGWTATISLPELIAASTSSPAASKDPASPGKPFNGIFNLIELPVDFSLGTLESDGQVTLITAPGIKPIQVAAKLKGGNLSSGQTGKFTLSLQVEGVDLPAALAPTAPGGAAASPRIDLETTLETRMATPRTLESILASLTAKTGSESALVKLAAYAATAGKPEEFSMFLDTKGTTRTRVTGKWHPDTRTAEGEWMLNLSNADIASYAAAAGVSLPVFAADGQGAFTYAIASGDATAAGRLQVRAGLREFVPELGNTDVVIVTEFDAGLKSSLPRVEKFTATVSTGETLVSAQTVQAFAFDPVQKTIVATDPARDLVRIEIPGLPLSLVEPFLASSGIKIKGAPVRGAWAARLDGDTVRLSTEKPLTLELSDVKQNGQTLAANLSLALQDLSATYSPKGWEASLGKFILSSSQELVAITASARQPAGGKAIAFEAGGSISPAALATQPVLAALEMITAGKLSFDARGSLGDELSAKASLSLASVRLRGASADLPEVAIQASANRKSASLPIAFDASVKSRLESRAPQKGVPLLDVLAAAVLDLQAQGTMGDALAAKVNLKLDGLRTHAIAGQAPAALPSLALNADLTRTAAGVITLKTPLTLTNTTLNRSSDLALDAKLTPSSGSLDAQVQVASNLFYVADAQALAALASTETSQTASSSAKSSSSSTSSSSTASKTVSGPPWAGLTGQLGLTLKKIVYTDDLHVTDVGGAIKITPDTLLLDGIKAILGGGSSLKLDGSLAYNKAKPASAYALKADLALKNFETAPWLRALSADPRQPAMLETKLNIDGNINAAAADLTTIADRAQGEFKIASDGGGICRALAGDLATRINKTTSNASKAADLVSGIAGLLGKGDKTAKVTSKANSFVDGAKELAAYLDEIKFDQLTVVAKRGSDLNAVLQDLTLLSPEIRLTGSGQITHVEGTPLARQALALNLNLAGKDALARIFEKTKLTGGTADASGYIPFFTPVKIGGSLEKVDTSDFTNAIVEHVVGLGAGAIGNLLDR